jgi:hypothetical protein
MDFVWLSVGMGAHKKIGFSSGVARGDILVFILRLQIIIFCCLVDSAECRVTKVASPLTPDPLLAPPSTESLNKGLTSS